MYWKAGSRGGTPLHEFELLYISFCSEIDKITDGIGYKLGNMVQSLVSFFAGYIIAFIYCWRLSLVLAAMFPVMIVLGSFMSKVGFKLPGLS